MECREAIEIIREHLTELRFDPGMYVNGEPKIDLIFALEDFAIPAMMKEICRDVVLKTASCRQLFYACPNCNDFIKWAYSGSEPERCPFCGQSLNWRGENN